jgi:crotonobetainyl-CoA:carnitine CoA-transferase CaiB-like acyl-CoA transferase
MDVDKCIDSILSGTTVLDMTVALAGPLSTLRLADLGANVIKIEGPVTPDITRNSDIGGVELPNTSTTTSYVSLNRDKKSLVLDLKDANGTKVFERIIAESEVLVTNYRPNALQRLGITFERLSEINNKLVFVKISGYGLNDPEGKLPGIDLLLQAHTGIVSTAGTQSDPFHPSPVFAVDVATSHLATEAVLAGLLHVARHRRGIEINISMLQAAMELQLQEFSSYISTGHMRARGKIRHPSLYMDPPYGIYQLQDGHIAITRSQLDKIAKVLNSQELLDIAQQRPPEVPTTAMAKWRDSVVRLLAKHLETYSCSALLSKLREADIWVAKVQSYDEIIDSGDLEEFLIEVPLTSGRSFKTLGRSIGKTSKVKEKCHFVASFAEHTDEILKTFGLSEDELADLEKNGTIVTKSISCT